MACLPDVVQGPRASPIPRGAEGYPTSPSLMMGTALPQTQAHPVVGTDFSQVNKLTEGMPTAHAGVVGFSSMTKTPPKPVHPRHTPECGLSPDSKAGGMSLRRGCGSAGSSTVSSSASGPGGRGGMTGRSNTSSSTTPGSRLNSSRRLSTPVARPLPGVCGLLASNSLHTEYREQMSPSWWLGAAAGSSAWLQLAPPQEVIELVEKKKLTEQFKTLEGLIDRADYLGSLRLQADKRNVLHFLALDEQEMQSYFWQPRYPRIVDLRNRAGTIAAQPSPRPLEFFIDPKQLWLKLLTISPPIYSAEKPIPAYSAKEHQEAEFREKVSALYASWKPKEIQEYCLGASGEQFLPILFDDSGVVADCVPPEELLRFEEDAVREIASHLEAKLTHALTCMLLAAKARTKTVAASKKHKCLLVAPASTWETSDDGGEAVKRDSCPDSRESTRGEGKRLRLNGGTLTAADCFTVPKRRKGAFSSLEKASYVGNAPSLRGARSRPDAHGGLTLDAWEVQLPPDAASGSKSCGTFITLEDIATTYGAELCLLRHPNCFIQEKGFRA